MVAIFVKGLSVQRMGPMAVGMIVLLAVTVACGGRPEGDAQKDVPQGNEQESSPVTAPDTHEFRLPAPRELVTRDDAFRVTWHPEGGVVPINEHFSVDVTLTRNDEARTPVTGADISMTAFMPEHGHGMLREPRSEELGEGRYRVNGFLLHMDGYWTVSVNVLVDGLAASAEDELRL